jgi:hypothetical protein
MERELLLAVKDKNYNKERVENEIEVMKKLLPYIEAYSTFKENNEILDLHTHKLIKNNIQLKDFFESGVQDHSRYHIICKN